MKLSPSWLLPATLLLAACGGQAAPAPSSAAAEPASAKAPASAVAPASAGAASVKPAGSAAAAPASKPAQKVSMKSAYTTTSATVAPQWVTKEAGFFDQEGQDVTLTRIDEEPAPPGSAIHEGRPPGPLCPGQGIWGSACAS